MYRRPVWRGFPTGRSCWTLVKGKVGSQGIAQVQIPLERSPLPAVNEKLYSGDAGDIGGNTVDGSMSKPAGV